jgi:hypothetical protein
MDPASGFIGTFARLSIALLAAAALGSCGSGAVSAPPVVVTPGPIVISPATATLYSSLPTSFVVTGGNGTYIITSSDQAILPISSAFTGGNVLTVVPNPVAVDTPVILTVRDTGTSTPATATLTVKPRTVSNIVTITPSPSQPTTCNPAVCSGGDAEVKATLALNGVPITGHEVRFDVISGDFHIITSAPGQPETLALSGTTFTDGSGVARIRIRADVDATPQTGLIQITDTTSGAFQRTSFVITQSTGASPGFFVTPSQVTFSGPRADLCATGTSVDFYIFGGAPPYTISNTNPTGFSVSPTFVQSSAGSFTVTANGQCVGEPGLPIVVRDSLGRTVTATVANKFGTVAATPLQVAPDTVTLSDCVSSASVTAVGGTGNYIANSGSGSVMVIPSGNTFTIQRRDSSPASTSPVTVGISDGVSTATVRVNLTGAGAGACPTPATPPTPPAAIVANPTSVTLTDCTTNRSFQASGGNPSATSGYSTIVSGNSIRFQQLVGGGQSTYFVSRLGTAAFGATPNPSVQQFLTVTDGNLTVDVFVNFTGAAAGVCP